MHSIKSRIIAIFVIAVIVAGGVFVALSGMQIRFPEPSDENGNATSYAIGKDTINIWYTDEALTDYLNYVAVGYSSVNEDVRVVPTLVSGLDYMEGISEASMTDEGLPDLYITTNDMLEKAHLAGLAETIAPPDAVDITSLFPQMAIDSVTYKDNLTAYPLFMECSAMCINYTYLEQWARNTLESEIRAQMAEEAKEKEAEAEANKTADSDNKTDSDKKEDSDNKDSDNKDEEEKTEEAVDVSSMVSDEEVAAYVEERLPSSIDTLLALSDDFDAPEKVDTIFKWAVTDIFYNYFFIGDSIDIGGECGDDIDKIDIYNLDAILGLTTYQKLNQFFSISTDDVSYGGVIEDFENGRIVMTIVTTDAVKTLADAKAEAAEETRGAEDAEGTVDFEYKFLPLPDISETADGRSMSVTDCVVVNGYSSQKEAANDFAYYLCTSDPAALYEWTGKVSPLSGADLGAHNDELQVFLNEYDESIPLPKMLETSNYWVNLEMLFASVWDGADANKGLKDLSEQMKLQATGKRISEETIEIPVEEEEDEGEFIDDSSEEAGE
ncbi:MAG: sugar ABC transporter substrate-binding protein [Lachnospiraceae bacterium]|nr:sugar ABC transporter substrate-binding protein [Lachnospiraceae bacterium]